jgi:VCBS repeat-containing protein
MLNYYFDLLTSPFVKTTKAKLGWIAAATVFLASLFSFIFSFPALAAPGDETTPGSLTLVPTIECIGVIVEYTGDNNQNNSAVLEYRELASDWKSAPQMYADRGRGEYRGSIFWLTANTDYEVKVTFIDSADGVSGTNPVQATTKTRNDSPPSNGDTYYVATNGSDSNPGTDALPFKTIQKAANTVAAGDTVYIRTGTYNEFVDIESSGTENNYITFMNYNSESVTLTGGGTQDSVIYIETQNYIRIKGLTIRSTTWGSIVISGCNDIIVEDCTFIHDTAESESGAIMLYDDTEKCLIQRNNFHITAPYQENNQHAVYRWRAGGGHVFRHNTIDTANNALQDGWGGGPEDVTGYSQDSDLYGNTIIGANDDGLQPEGGNVNVRVWNNRIENGLMGIGSCPTLLGPIYIFRNVIINKNFYSESGGGGMYKLGDSSYGRIYSYHNTYYTTQDSHNGYTVTNGGFGNMVSRNNIIHAGRYVIEFGHTFDIEDHDFDYDNLYTTDPDRFVKWGDWKPLSLDAFQSGSGQEPNGMSANSQFANPDSGDFTLQETSPCIDKGTILLGFNDANSPWPYKGLAPDLGAYEYDSGAPTNDPPVAVNDDYSTNQDTVLDVTAPGVLSNDTDPEGSQLTAVKVSDPAHGTLILNANGSFSYTPSSGYTGTESFTYTANDGYVNSDTATVTITVNSDNGTNLQQKKLCFIATAAFGSPLHPMVRILQDFRDKYLMPSRLGQRMVDFYYRHSPKIASLIAKHRALKLVVCICLLPLVGFSYSLLHFGPAMTAVMLLVISAAPFICKWNWRKRRKGDDSVPGSHVVNFIR